VLLDGGGSISVKSNFVGVTSLGGNIGNVGPGIWIRDGSVKNSIVGNDVGDNGVSFGGIQIEGTGTTGNLVQSNTIGLSTAGAAAPNFDGVLIENGASDNIVGGATAALRNVISANSQDDVAIVLAGTTGNMVESNFIGTNLAGTAAAPKQSVIGVSISNASGNRIGGVGAGNVISGNSSNSTGIDIFGAMATGNVVQGNMIGTDKTGTAAIANAFGIIIRVGATGNQIGGTLTDTGNVIAGNTSYGVVIEGANTSVVQGNRIGVGLTNNALPNGTGVFIEANSANNLIGGTGANAGNIIADNTQNGVNIGFSSSDTATTGNAVLGNRIFGNGGYGIDLGNDGITNNSSGGPHSGPNDLQNTPVLNAPRLAGGDVIVTGLFNGASNTTFRIEVYASSAAGPFEQGEGQVFLGYVTVRTNGSGNASFTAAFSFAGAPGKFISATATEVMGTNTVGNLLFGDTSEFSTAAQFFDS
jgi:hypothetical protein